ncbi:MAG: hypothetical protein NXI32_27395, partial [bacterium]|nr:hypothetical protein [bacterium]
SDLDGLHPLIGQSPDIELAMQRAQLAAGSHGNYFVWGPLGAGKSEVARGIFQRRLKRAGLSQVSGQFFPLDCRLLDVSLFDGMLEIFAGRLRGEAPHFSQLLVLEHLDELADESLVMLTNWLSEPAAENCSICGLSRQSAHMLSQRSSDWSALVCRLAVTEIHLPELRRRREDIAPLIYQQLGQACRESNRPMLSIAPAAMDLLTAYDWPQNLKQLRTVMAGVLKAAELATSVQTNHLPIEIRTLTSQLMEQDEFGAGPSDKQGDLEPIRLDDVLQDLERMILRRALKLSPRNRAQVARWLDISRPRLLRRLSQLGLDQESPESSENGGQD